MIPFASMNRQAADSEAQSARPSMPVSLVCRMRPAVTVACLLLPPAMLLQSCKTQRTITTKSSRYIINEDTGDGVTGTADTGGVEETREHFGTSYAEAFGEDEGGGDARRSSLENKMFGGDTRDVTAEEFRGAKKFGETQEFRTPDFLKRQEIRDGDRAAQESTRNARQGQVSYRESDLTYRGSDEELTFWQKLNPFRKSNRPAREQSRVFRTGDFGSGNEAIAEAPTPEPMGTFGEGIGDYRESSMSMDDVRKLLDPGAFSR